MANGYYVGQHRSITMPGTLEGFQKVLLKMKGCVNEKKMHERMKYLQSAYNPTDLVWDCHLPLLLVMLFGIGFVSVFI